MIGIFDFLNDLGNYEQRKIAKYDSKDGKVMISTAAISDSSFPFETALRHPEYNDGEIIVVANYNNKKEALAGHEKVLEMICGDNLPCEIIDCSGATTAAMRDRAGSSEAWRIHPRQKRRK